MLANFESIMTSKNNATMKKRTETILKKNRKRRMNGKNKVQIEIIKNSKERKKERKCEPNKELEWKLKSKDTMNVKNIYGE